MTPTVATSLHNLFSSGSGQVVNARKPATTVVPVTTPVGTGLTRLDATEMVTKAKDLETKLHSLVIGQEEAVRQIVRTYQSYLAGLSREGRPIGNFLFLGPTGTGKTRAVEAAAKALLGDPRAVTKIDCSEFPHNHENANPLLAQELLDQQHTNSLKLSLVLFNEIERAGDALWNMLLGILDKATLALGDNRKLDFSNALIFMTSNIGAAEICSLVSPKLMLRAGTQAVRRTFTPEFLNRLDKIVMFRALGDEELNRITESPSLKLFRETDTWQTWKANWAAAA